MTGFGRPDRFAAVGFDGGKDGSEDGLLLFDRIVGPGPFAPSALEGIGLGISVLVEFLCHTGTGVFIVSGAVQDHLFVLGMVVGPSVDFFRIDPHSPLDFELAAAPVTTRTDVQN